MYASLWEVELMETLLISKPPFLLFAYASLWEVELMETHLEVFPYTFIF